MTAAVTQEIPLPGISGEQLADRAAPVPAAVPLRARLAMIPCVNARSGRLVGAQVLLRCPETAGNTVTLRALAPSAPGTVERLLDAACRHAQRWVQQGHRDFLLHARLCQAQFWRADLPEMIHSLLEETGLPPRNLALEFSEEMMERELTHARTLVKNLHDIGARTLIHDYDGSNSAFALLKLMPLDGLRMQASFVRRLANSRDDLYSAEFLCDYADTHGLLLVAEGVDSKAQVKLLLNSGVTRMQGGLFSAPMPAGNLERVLHLQEP